MAAVLAGKRGWPRRCKATAFEFLLVEASLDPSVLGEAKAHGVGIHAKRCCTEPVEMLFFIEFEDEGLA